MAEVYTIGSRKYADHNWRKGRPASDWLDALYRHLAKYAAGETFDPDGQHHLASVVFHAFALMEQEVTHPGLDDRFGLDIYALDALRDTMSRQVRLDTDAAPLMEGVRH